MPSFKLCNLYLLVILLLAGYVVSAQKKQSNKLYLRNGIVESPPGLPKYGRVFRQNSLATTGKLIVIQFHDIPSEQSVTQLRNAGIELLEYIPDNAYTAIVTREPDLALLNSVNAASIIELTPEQKIHPSLSGPEVPAHVVKVPGKMDVRISYPRSVDLKNVRTDFQSKRFEMLSESLSDYQILEVRLEKGRLRELAALPWLQYIEAIPAPTEPLNDKSAAGTRANVLASEMPGGRRLDGEGVVIGIGDIGIPYEHADLSGRIASYTKYLSDWHGVHIAGTAAGAGIVNEKYRGYAPRAKIVMQPDTRIWEQAPAFVRDFGMVVTNNAYASSAAICPYFGEYQYNSYILDRQAGELPHLLHVFAAGNSGMAGICNGFPAGFGNVHGEYASAKNVISVGLTGADGLLSPASSRGPVQDGRIKPELIAPGEFIISTIPGDAYRQGSGTSMASPAVTGGTALLYQRYRQLHSEQNPKSALIKALLCNGASDKGLAGPDFSYGFGVMNLLRSVTMLDKGNYANGTLAHQGESEIQVTVPAGTAVLKVMLYWHDRASSVLTGSKSLVNDLDLKVIRPVGSPLLPLVPNPEAPGVAAVAGVDTLNNAEQIVIENPDAGTYTLKIAGTKIPAGSQEYFVVYDVIEKSAVLTYPIGSEHLSKGDAVNISWDSYGNPASTFAVSYSLNNGAAWSTINAAVPAASTRLSWTVPDAFTATARIRLVQNETGAIRESGTFSIMGLPVISLSPLQCEGYAGVQWTAVNGASDYEVMRLQGSEMKPVAVTTELKYTFTGLSRDTTYYFSVRPRLNGIPGRRAVAIKRKPDSGTCAGTISDNDMGIDSIISPKGSGRMLTSSSLLAAQPVTIGIRNFDDQPLTRSFEVGYSIGGSGAVYWETITSGMPALGYLKHTFSKTVDFYAAGNYVVNVFVKLDGDIVQANNQKTVAVTQLPNPPLTLPFTEGFESLPPQTLHTDKIGLENGPGYDFISESNIGQLRTYIGPGIAYSGERALTLDADNWDHSSYTTTVIGTYNLADYNAQGKEVRLAFRFRPHGHNGSNNGVYVRGKDSDPWISALRYDADWYLPVDKGFVLGTIPVSELLKSNSQALSTSFQVMWQQQSYYPAEKEGYTIDDVKLYTTRSDVELVKIIQPEVPACYGPQKLAVIVKNNGEEDMYGLPLQVTVDGNEAFKDIIPVVRAGKDTLYTFNAYSNLNLEGDHVLKARLIYGFDTNPANDSVQILTKTPPVISAFPYLEDFENGPGDWQAIDANPGWQFGQPNSAKVKGAASGENAWKTNLTGTYQSDSTAYLYSPCFNLDGIASLRLSFSFFIDQEACNAGGCEMPVIEYSVSSGIWSGLYGIEWGNLQGRSRWRTASLYIPGYSSVRLRIGVKGNSQNPTDGMAIDDIHIYNLSYEITSESSANPIVRENVQGDKWVDFTQFGWMVASIQPNGQELGNVSLMTYFKNDEVRYHNGQYYMGRGNKFTASQPAFSRPVGVRLYFLDSDVDKLVTAPDKTGVIKPGSAYDLTVTKYSGISEDGDLTNNADKVWTYFPKSEVKIVPYWNGYYIEFQTKTFSEFWMAKGFLGMGDPMPVTIARFSARKQTTGAEKRASVLLEWETAREEDFSHFEVEVARDRQNLLKNMFSKLGEMPGKGASTMQYAFTDNFPPASGTCYYRLKSVDADGSFEYSSVRSVSFNGEKEWKVFPNPAKEKIAVELEEEAGKLLTFSLCDMEGNTLLTDKLLADGSIQKKEINLSSAAIRQGVYLLKVTSANKERIFKIVKE